MIRRLAFSLFPWLDGEKRDKAIREDYARVFGTTAGRRVLADILNLGNVANSTGHLTHRRRVDVNDGRRQLALQIFDYAGGARDRLTMAMIEDNLQEAMNHERNSDNEPTGGPIGEPDADGRFPGDPLYGEDGDGQSVDVVQSGDDIVDDIDAVATGDE